MTMRNHSSALLPKLYLIRLMGTSAWKRKSNSISPLLNSKMTSDFLLSIKMVKLILMSPKKTLTSSKNQIKTENKPTAITPNRGLILQTMLKTPNSRSIQNHLNKWETSNSEPKERLSWPSMVSSLNTSKLMKSTKSIQRSPRQILRIQFCIRNRPRSIRFNMMNQWRITKRLSSRKIFWPSNSSSSTRHPSEP